MTNILAAESFGDEVKRRARAILSLRRILDAEHRSLCICALDIAATRGDYSEDAIVQTAKAVADDTIRWR